VAENVDSAVRRLKEMAGDVPIEWERPLDDRVYLTLRPADAREFVRMLFEDYGARFATASGMDTGQNLEVVYHFPYDPAGLVVNVRLQTPKSNGVLPSLTPVIPAAEWIEREMSDLVGIRFEGHPRPERLILADDWPEGVYPLRKEFRKEFQDE
jgi:NADH-quinone oxidoreductase subunit C